MHPGEVNSWSRPPLSFHVAGVYASVDAEAGPRRGQVTPASVCTEEVMELWCVDLRKGLSLEGDYLEIT